MSLLGVIARFSTGTYTVTRRTKGAPSLGRATAGSTSTFQINAGVQPTTGADVEFAPELVRAREMITIYSPTELLPERAGNHADVVTVSGRAYEVVTSREWTKDAETIYVVLAALVSQS